jgi:hypothetical protein
MALRVPKAPGFASMMKEGAKYMHGKRLNNYLRKSNLINSLFLCFH